MKKFIISYDLIVKDIDLYKDLYSLLEILGGIRLQNSLYFLKCQMTTKEIISLIEEVIEENDRVFVSEILDGIGLNSLNNPKKIKEADGVI